MKSTVTFDLSDNLAGIKVHVTVLHEDDASDSQVQAVASKLLKYRIQNLESYNQISGPMALEIVRHDHA